ncbi:MAG: Cdc6/Cdc18 family protein [Candidatus Bathyarchaeia archaeon]
MKPSVSVAGSIFSDKRVFQLEYVPDRILHRDVQIAKIRGILADLDRGVRPRHMLGVGDFGTGKTAVVRSICRNLPPGVSVSYVNCSEQNTENRVIRNVLRDLNVPVKLGFPSDHYLQLFKESVGGISSLILIMDEVDKLIERKDSNYEELFYTLGRSVTNVVVILLTNRVSLETTLLSNLDSRVRDTFRLERIEFGDYDALELGSILTDRCRIGLNDNSYDAGIIASIARIAFKQGMRARGIIDLTRKAGEIAESHGHETITFEDVRVAEMESSQDREMEIIHRLPPPHRVILAYVFVNSPKSNAAYDWFRTYASEHGFGQSPVTFHGYVKELETMGLMRKEKHGRGRGRGVEMRLIIPQELLNTVENSFNVDKRSSPHAEKYHTHPTSEYVN